MNASNKKKPQSVSVVLGNNCLSVGRLDFIVKGNRESSAFTYDQRWLAETKSFDLAPNVPRKAVQHFAYGGRGDHALLGIFSDAAPDSWGRRLLRRKYGEGLSELDYLLLSDDETRLGALRFLDGKGQPLTVSDEPVPRVADLGYLTQLAHRFVQDPASAKEEADKLVGVAGSAGGARPKANIRDEKTSALWIAKFTEYCEDLPTERVEVATLALAENAGLRAPEARLELGQTDIPVGVFKRFDRTADGRRLHYMSARSALGKKQDEQGYYSEIAQVLQSYSVAPEKDMHEMWARMVFSILVRNTDDHLKNHGFVYARDGKWRLSPLFDVNPQPTRVPKMETGISPEHGFEPDIRAAIEAGPLFLIEEDEAARSTARIAQSISANWQEELRAQGVLNNHLKLYVDAFEHDEMEYALRMADTPIMARKSHLR